MKHAWTFDESLTWALLLDFSRLLIGHHIRRSWRHGSAVTAAKATQRPMMSINYSIPVTTFAWWTIITARHGARVCLTITQIINTESSAGPVGWKYLLSVSWCCSVFILILLYLLISLICQPDHLQCDQACWITMWLHSHLGALSLLEKVHWQNLEITKHWSDRMIMGGGIVFL